MEDTKKMQNEGICKVKEQLLDDTANEETWRDMVSKVIEDNLLVITADLSSARETAKMYDTSAEEVDKVQRKNA